MSSGVEDDDADRRRQCQPTPIDDDDADRRRRCRLTTTNYDDTDRRQRCRPTYSGDLLCIHGVWYTSSYRPPRRSLTRSASSSW
ncbi:hypothetical protein G5I_11275 [Acromyrmex echinatior]|uniref:Uncharacterized protein n=1 Tax=Acromyrmex echinatior TaxID=103372 RepID=F4WZ63_ACREC|nr:hypothetical protein G5I_11275 [Acromyrmex echinatior]